MYLCAKSVASIIFTYVEVTFSLAIKFMEFDVVRYAAFTKS